MSKREMESAPSTSMQKDLHPGGMKRLSQLVEDFQLTMQHALRNDIRAALEARAAAEAGPLQPLSPHEEFDYLLDTDDQFLNWLFPYCAFTLTFSNMGPIHRMIVTQLRRDLEPMVDPASEN